MFFPKFLKIVVTIDPEGVTEDKYTKIIKLLGSSEVLSVND